MSTKPLCPVIAKPATHLMRCYKALEAALLDRSGNTEDVLGEPRFQITLAIRSLGAVVLVNDPKAIETLGTLQRDAEGVLRSIDQWLPRSQREYTVEQAAPALAPLLEQLVTMLTATASLNGSVSPLATMF